MVKYFGVPKELKEGETRVSLTPDTIGMLAKEEIGVLVEENAGLLAGFKNEEYVSAGAKIVTAEELWEKAQYIIKVKEPQPSEYKYFKPEQVIFSYLHLNVEKALTDELLKKKVCAIASETVQEDNGEHPILRPMSEVAGRFAIQAGAKFLEKTNNGLGVLLGGVPGVEPAKVVIIGAGVVGTNAAKIAIGMGADVSVLDTNSKRLANLDLIFGGQVKTFYSNPLTISEEAKKADILVGAASIANPNAPKLISADIVRQMKKGSVIIDVAIDQGGIVETIDRITTHDDPIFEKFGVLHYAVPNIPSAVPKTASLGYSYAILPYIKQMEDIGVIQAIKANEALGRGVSTFRGSVTNEALANTFGYEHTELSLLVGF